MSDDDLFEGIKRTLDEADWLMLQPHVDTGALIFVSHELDLFTVAVQMARDDKVVVQQYIDRGLILRPTDEQIKGWSLTPDKKFMTTIVQPFILSQEIFLN